MVSKKDSSLALAGALLVWPFIFDTTFTFFRRLKNKENVFAAHRTHLYQRLVISGYKHRTVTLLYPGLNVLGLILAFMIIKNKVWTDLVAVMVLSIACFSLWGFTMRREKEMAHVQSQN